MADKNLSSKKFDYRPNSSKNMSATVVAPLKTPREMPPLPLLYSGSKVDTPAPPDTSPAPPDALPKPVVKRESTVTPRLASSTQPAYADELASPRSGQAGLTIRQIATDIVAAELENGLDLKQIGRLSPKLNGVGVYSRLATYVNRELGTSQFVGLVDKCRQAVMAKFEKEPEKLTVVEGSATDARGEHTGVDLKRVARYLAPIFGFVCGPQEHFADCNLPTGVLSLFKAVDRELLATLLARREQQLAAQKLWSASLPSDQLAEKLKEPGWTDSQFKKLVNEGVFTAVKIHAFRVNMFSGLLFTRCISPFILYSSDELQQESSKRTANPARALVKLSEGANKLFKKNHAAFVEDFISDSNSVLPEDCALALATISSGEDRFSKVKTSKKSPSGSSRAYSRSPGRHSAPVLPQGLDFRKAMEEEKKAAEAESALPAPERPPVDDKIRRDAAIARFTSRHATDFADDDFAIAFSLALRQWKRDNRGGDIAAVPAAMKLLRQQVKKDLAVPETLERDGPLVQSPMRRSQASSSQRSSSSTTASSSTTTTFSLPPARVSAPAMAILTDERNDLLERFVNKPGRRTSFERYPTLKHRLQQQAISWTRQDSGGSFGLALKSIYEDELVRSFHKTCLLMGDGSLGMSRKEMRAGVAEWKTDNKGEDVTLEVLWSIMPKIMRSLTLDSVRPTSLTRNAEAVTEAFLQRFGVAGELQNNPLLKKRFLHDIREWIALGADSVDPATSVQQIYHEALTTQYEESLRAAKEDPVHARKIRLAAMKWWEDNDAEVLSTAILDELYAAIKNDE